jgi:hypothetical protein
MRKNLTICFLFFAIGSNLFSQGILGKKAVIKVGVINGLRTPLNDLQFEYALGKNFSITAGYSLLASKIRPEYRLSYAYEFLNTASSATLLDYEYTPLQLQYIANKQLDSRAYDYEELDVFNSPEKLTVKSSVWSLGFRKYRNSVFSAPYGKYFSMEFFRGKQEVSGTIQAPVPTVDDFNFLDFTSYYIRDHKEVKIQDRVINTTSFQMNFGRQWVKFDVLTIDFSWGFAYSITKAENRAQDGYVASILARHNGANFGSFPETAWNTVSSGVEYRRSAIGLNLFLRVGYLLF